MIIILSVLFLIILAVCGICAFLIAHSERRIRYVNDNSGDVTDEFNRRILIAVDNLSKKYRLNHDCKSEIFDLCQDSFMHGFDVGMAFEGE